MTDRLSVTLFGNPKIQLNDEAVTGFVSNKASALIYYLATTGRSHSRDALAGLLWTDYPEAQAKKNLRGVLYHLRKQFDTANGSILDITRTSVGLNEAAEIAVDVLAFEREIADAERSPPQSAEQLEHLRAAAALYQGELLEGVHSVDAEAFDEWLLVERERLNQLGMLVFNQLVNINKALGNWPEGINHASTLLTFDPWREESHRQLMQMLAHNGQQSAALAQYQSCKRVLEEELGVGPAAETVALYEKIVAGRLTPTPADPSPADPSVQPISAPDAAAIQREIPHNLAAELTSYVGRDDEIAKIVNYLQAPQPRLITITGLGGIGKTRLAQRIAHFVLADGCESGYSFFGDAFAHGIYFASLAAFDAQTGTTQELPSRLALAIANAINIHLSGESAPLAELTDFLRAKKMLLILDNFEHLLAAAPVVNDLLQQASALRLIITSRARLNLRSEAVLTLDGLALPEATLLADAQSDSAADTFSAFGATALFMQTAHATTPDFALSPQTQEAVIRTCLLVQGIPLGIELAASWTRLLSCDEIADEIQQNFDFLENATADVPERHLGLRAVFDYSWGLLTEDEREALSRLSIFRGRFDRKAATQVASANLRLLLSLADKSLIRRVDDVVTGAGTRIGADRETSKKTCTPAMRFELQEMVRQYAHEKLLDRQRLDEIAAHHARHYATLLSEQTPFLIGTGQHEALSVINSDVENVRAAWRWLGQQVAMTSDSAVILVQQSLDALFHFYDMRSWFQEGEAVFGEMADNLADANFAPAESLHQTRNLVAAKLRARQGWYAFHLGEFAKGRQLLEDSLAQLRLLDEREAAFNLNYLGALLRHVGELEQAESYLNEALTVTRGASDRYGESISLNVLGQVASLRNQLDDARNFCTEALHIKREIGDRWGMTYSLSYVGWILQAQERHADAQKLFDECMKICAEISDRRGIAFSFRNMGNSHLALGELPQAQACFQECLYGYREIGNRTEASHTLTLLTQTARQQDELDVAKISLDEALQLALATKSVPALQAALTEAAYLANAQGLPGRSAAILAALHPQADSPKRQSSLETIAMDLLQGLL